ncbi:MFS transporter [Thermococcus bergensis]|uniref:MFS transporter n=1 Tax=Thermococcus bergensis TaxID=2689387 RepID=UPI001CEDEB21|nr:MFS transporter [Thermococcus bergensis]MCA6213995.1 MFS transporter [Thermococcus bergensis]
MKDNRNFWLYAMGRFVSLVGSGVQDVALPLFILVTGSGTIMGIFMIISMLPRLILYPIAGVVGDKINRKWIMVWMDFGRGAVILFLALLASRNLITIPILFAAQFVVSLMNALFGPATGAMLPDIVEKEELMRANSILMSLNSTAYIVGPALGGIIYGVGGIMAAFLINGVSFIASGVSELFIRYEQKVEKIKNIGEIVDGLRDGLNYIRVQRGILILMSFVLVVNFLAVPIFAVLYPYVMRVVIKFSAEQYGFLETSFMGGILLGNLLIGAFFAKKKAENLLVKGLIFETVFLLVFAILMFPQSIAFFLGPSWRMFGAIALVSVLMGISNAFVTTPLNVEFQQLVPTEYRARVFSVVEVMSQGIVPIGYGMVGILLDKLPAHWIAFSLTVLILISVLLFVAKYSRVVFMEFENKKKEVEMNLP